MAPPSEMTMPLRFLSKGREALVGSSWAPSAPWFLKPAKMPKVWMDSETPPAKATSTSPSWSICAAWMRPALPAAQAAPMV